MSEIPLGYARRKADGCIATWLLADCRVKTIIRIVLASDRFPRAADDALVEENFALNFHAKRND